MVRKNMQQTINISIKKNLDIHIPLILILIYHKSKVPAIDYQGVYYQITKVFGAPL